MSASEAGLGICGGVALALVLLAAGTLPTAAADDSPCSVKEGSDLAGPTVMEIRLTGDVGPDMANRLFAELDKHLAAYPTIKTVKVLLSSGGGFVESGIMIHNYLKGLHQRHALQVVTHNVGSVQSAAVDIYCAGNQRVTSPYTFFMVHDGNFDLDKGNYEVKDISDMDEENVVTSKAGHSLFSACTNLTIAAVGKMYQDQTYIDPDEALELGLAHSIQPATFDRTADIRCLIDVGDASKPADEDQG